MRKLTHFYHDGFGWICQQCAEEMNAEKADSLNVSKVFTEGEAESKAPDLATQAIAKWADPARRFLMCPRCGITEDTEVN